MSFLSLPSRTRGHLLPPLHRDVSSQPPPGAVAAVQAALQAGEPAGSPRCLPWETNQRDAHARCPLGDG